MAQDWLNTLDYDLGGLHPDAATRLTQLFTSLRTGFSGSTAPADPVEGQTWIDTSQTPSVPKIRRGGEWHELSSGPSQAAPAAGTTRSSVWSGGQGSTTVWATITEDLTIADAASSSTTALIPAGSRVRAVGVRVLAQPTGPTFLNVGVAAQATRFGAGLATDVDTVNVSYGSETKYSTAVPIVVTPNTTPSAADGSIRIQIHYELVTAPDSGVLVSPPV